MAFTQKDTTHVISSWVLTGDYLGKSPVEIDTSVDQIHIYNPVNQVYFSNSALGNYGSPSVSNVMSDRYEKNEFFFTNVYYPLMYTHDKTIFVNTRRQFTRLMYVDAGSRDDKEENLQVFHSQNVNPQLNFGLKYNTTLSQGQYKFQRTKRSSFSFFSSYESELHSLNLSLNTNNFSTNENGGITNDSLLGNANYDGPGDLPTFFSKLWQLYNVQPEKEASRVTAEAMFKKYLTWQDVLTILKAGYSSRLVGRVNKKFAAQIILRRLYEKVRDNPVWQNEIETHVDELIDSFGLNTHPDFKDMAGTPL